MREILFKAKRIDNGEWVEINPFEEGFGGTVPIDRDTICQYVGETDAHGNKIFENDIVTERYREFVGKIVFSDCGFEARWQADGLIRKDIIFFKKKRGIEVIGNAFDNPELLEKAR